MSRSKIVAARIEDLPTVLTTEQVRAVTLLGENSLRDMVANGVLVPLAYSRSPHLFYRREVERFLEAQTRVVTS